MLQVTERHASSGYGMYIYEKKSLSDLLNTQNVLITGFGWKVSVSVEVLSKHSLVSHYSLSYIK